MPRKAVDAIVELTADPKIKAIDPDELAPGYSAVCEELARLEARLFNKSLSQ